MQTHGRADEPVGLLIGAARRRIKQAVGRRASRFRLTPQQFWILLAIQGGRATSLGALAERLRGDQPTASRVVAALVRRKLVRVDVDPADRRRTLLRCTAAGTALKPRLAALATEMRAAIVDGMDAAEEDVLRAGLRKVIDNIDRLENGAARKTSRRRARG